jgi:hypothetical protein
MALDIKNPYQAIIDVIDIILTKHEIAPDNITIHVCETTLPQSGLGSEQLRQILDMLKRSGAITKDIGRSPHMIKVKKAALFKERKKWIEKGSKDNQKQEPIYEEGERYSKIIANRLRFYPISGDAEYKTAIWQFKPGKKSYELLVFLGENKNTNWNVEDIKKYCNPKIVVASHKFKTEKDINDTIREVRQRLKVNKGEFFPIFKQEKGWIWLEK